MILFVKTKIKEDSVYCDLITIRMMCCLYGGVFRGGIFRSPFPTWSDMTQNCNNKAFLKLCRFLNNLVSFKECKPLFNGVGMFSRMLFWLQSY